MLLGFLAGTSYQTVAKAAGRDVTAVVVVLGLMALIFWRVRKGRRERSETHGEGDTVRPQMPSNGRHGLEG